MASIGLYAVVSPLRFPEAASREEIGGIRTMAIGGAGGQQGGVCGKRRAGASPG